MILREGTSHQRCLADAAIAKEVHTLTSPVNANPGHHTHRRRTLRVRRRWVLLSVIDRRTPADARYPDARYPMPLSASAPVSGAGCHSSRSGCRCCSHP